jgi:single-strand DNA-binding protein
MYNEATLIGRLGKDPELRHTHNQTAVGNLWLATSEVSTKDGKKTEHTEWHSIVVWGNTAENCKKYLIKGSLVFVKGRITSRDYTDKEGVKRKSTEIVANIVKFLNTKNDGNSQEKAPIHSSGEQDMSDWDSIPF